jgi:hypothetical protein
VLLLVTIFSSSCTILLDIASKDVFSYADADIELLEDTNMADTSETSIEEINETINAVVSTFDLRGFFSHFNAYFYLKNTYEIYLGLNTPPPKYF